MRVMKRLKIRKNLIRAVLASAVLSSTLSFSSFANELDSLESENITEIMTEAISDELSSVENASNVGNIVIENQPVALAKPENLGPSLGNFKLTSYCSCSKCNGRWTGYPTAAGTDYQYGRTIAVDRRLIPLGTWVYINIPGEGWQKFRAEDTGSAIKGNRIDVYIGDNHSECYQARYNQVSEVRLALD